MQSAGPRDARIAIIGAGMAGMAFALGLKRKYTEFEDFVIFERASEVGGTWRDNKYPGCASDVAMCWYSFSTELRAYWERPFAQQPTIHAYLVDVFEKHNFAKNCVFNTSVISATWNTANNVWHIVVENQLTGQRQEVKAEILVSAIGYLMSPKLPKILGLAEFQGDVFHSNNWRYDVSLAGKKVAVIGNGCTATQFVPIITEDPTTTVVNYAQTPMWYVPPLGNAKHWSTTKWALEHIPFLLYIQRVLVFLLFEIRFILWIGKRSWLNNFSIWGLTWWMKSMTPKVYHNQIIPNYSIGCKRVIVNSGYLESLHRPNMRLTFDKIVKVTKSGIVTSEGETQFDVIICATGFTTNEYPIAVRGRTGQTVQEFWTAQGGPTAYYGTTLPGYPNFFTLGGPNSTSGHASILFMEETQVQYALRVLQPVLEDKAASVEPTLAALQTFDDRMQRRLEDSPFSQCESYYRGGPDRKISSVWPDSATSFWWQTRKVTWADYAIS